MSTETTSKTLTFTQIFEEWADKHVTIDADADEAVSSLYEHYKKNVTKDPERFTLPFPMRTFISKLKKKFFEYQERKQVAFYYHQRIDKEERKKRKEGEEKELKKYIAKVRGLTLMEQLERRKEKLERQKLGDNGPQKIKFSAY